MATAKKLPSGNWRIRIGTGEAGKTKSFTAATKKECELLAAEWMLGRQTPVSEETIDNAANKYIESKINILSPSTIEGYRKILRNDLRDISYIRLCDLTQERIQRFVNQLASEKAPKTVHNAYGLLSSILTAYLPEKRFYITLPKKQKVFRSFPAVDEILTAVHGTEIELPVLLALWEGMRMSEIRGAKKTDIKDGVLTIHSTIITVDGVHIEKEATKTFDSARQLRLPQYILGLIDALPPEQEYLTELSGQAIYKRFQHVLEKNGVQKIRFHDLRHLNASIMLALGVPDRYAMERGGWSNPTIMRSVYQHTFNEERQTVDSLIDGYFSERVATRIATKT